MRGCHLEKAILSDFGFGVQMMLKSNCIGTADKRLERDAFGREVKEFFPDDTRVEYSYNQIGQLHKILDQSKQQLTFNWNKFGLGQKSTAKGGEENFDSIFESLQLHPSACGKVFRDIRNIGDPAFYATETGSPGRSLADPPDADVQRSSELMFSQKRKQRIATKSVCRPRRFPDDLSGQLSRNQKPEKLADLASIQLENLPDNLKPGN